MSRFGSITKVNADTVEGIVDPFKVGGRPMNVNVSMSCVVGTPAVGAKFELIFKDRNYVLKILEDIKVETEATA